MSLLYWARLIKMLRKVSVLIVSFIIFTVVVLNFKKDIENEFPIIAVPEIKKYSLVSSTNLDKLTRPELLDKIRSKHLTPPASRNLPYNLSNSYTHYAKHDQFTEKLLQILELYEITRGFFVEAGALDGQYLSHTLTLEMKHNWKGILIEPSPSLVNDLKSKNRKAWIADVCLADDYEKRDFIVKNDQAKYWLRGRGKVKPKDKGKMPKYFEGLSMYKSEGTVECFSLYSLLTAINVTSVDLLVLDLEGSEFQVLSSFPFHKIPIKVVAVEHWLMPEQSKLLRNLMEAQGYLLVHGTEADFVFAQT